MLDSHLHLPPADVAREACVASRDTLVRAGEQLLRAPDRLVVDKLSQHDLVNSCNTASSVYEAYQMMA